jgi:hypothetical protein
MLISENNDVILLTAKCLEVSKTQIIRTHGIKELIMKDLKELNGFHEVTDRVISNVTQPEWKEILGKHYPNLNMQNKNVNIDLDSETIMLE